MPQTKLETAIYKLKLAHKAWLDKVFLHGAPPPEEISELVWEMLITYAESADDIDEVSQDIYKTGYELASKVLEHTPIDQILKYYRDYLVDAVMDYTETDQPSRCRTLVRFANLLSSAYCEAHSDRLKRTIRHNRAERVSDEMRIAKQIQSHLMPTETPKVDGFDFAGRLIPAAEIGGDYWSIKHHVEEEIVTLKLADITGHGIAAATLVAAVKFISGGYYQGAASASEVMEKTNRVLAIETPHEILVTMVYAWLKPASFEVSIVNAGHAPIFLCQEESCADIVPTGVAMGLAEDSKYSEAKFTLKKGDILFFGSDGIIEAGAGKRFGIARLKEVVIKHHDLTADQIADEVVKAVRDYEKRPQDDISLLVTKVIGDPPESP
ncbi:MAG: PP2C family protein-serine/threonine phosphatase [Armatimonadota bacterium]